MTELIEGETMRGIKGVDATLKPGIEIAGSVVDLHGSAPIEGVEICPDPTVFHEGIGFACIQSDAAGGFALRNLGPGSYLVEFNTEGEVNYVETQFPTRSLGYGEGIDVEAAPARGVQIKGMVTEAGTGLPLEPPFRAVGVCALNSATEAWVKCAQAGHNGEYSIPGLPPGPLYAIAFAKDEVEEELDLHPDGYVRQYWDGVPAFGEATLISGSGGAVFAAVDAVLSRGEEVFPHCEVRGSCPPPASTNLSPTTGVSTTPPAARPPTAVTPTTKPKRVRKKGFHKVTRSEHQRCVKIHKKKHHPHRKAHH